MRACRKDASEHEREMKARLSWRCDGRVAKLQRMGPRDPAEVANSARTLSFLAAGGEWGERMRALDWSKTPLGPAEWWSHSLRSAVSTCIGSRFPIVLYWGPRRVVLYND